MKKRVKKISQERARWLGATIHLRAYYDAWPAESVGIDLPMTRDFLVNAQVEKAIKNVFLPMWTKLRRYARKRMPR